MRKNILLLSIIILLGFFLRFYHIGSVPPSLNWDEASIGYNAFSILNTGKDEYGKLFPLTFQSFGDFKQPVYIYLTTIPILFFGLNEISVRMPSALLGSVSIIFVFLLVKEFFYNSKSKQYYALTSAILYAFSPWSIQFSRFASEANVGICFIIAAVFFFLYAVRRNKLGYLLVADMLFVLSIYTYHSQKIFTPLLIGVLFFSHYKYFLKSWSKAVIFIICFVFLNLFWIIDPSATARGKSVLFTSEQTQLLENPIKYELEDRNSEDILGSFLHNRRVVYAKTFLNNYLSHFSPTFLFINGDNARHHAPYMGVEYLVSLPFLIVGILYLWKNYRHQAKIITIWILIAPITSSLAIDSPNAIRSMMFLPVIQICVALGIWNFYSVKKENMKRVVLVVISLLYISNVIYYVHQYFDNTNLLYARYWQFGYRDGVKYANSVQDSKVFFASDVEQAYIFYLFYSKKDPSTYLRNGGSKITKGDCYQIENSYFGDCSKYFDSGYFVSSKPLPSNLVMQDREDILFPDKTVALSIYQFKK